MGRQNRTWTLPAIVEAIRRRQADGKPLNTTAVLQEDPLLHAAARRRFGSWRAALAALGLGPTELWPPERILAALRDRVQNGQSLAGPRVAREDAALFVAAERLMGSWEEALAQAGVVDMAREENETDPVQGWTPERVIEALRLRRQENRNLRKAVLKSQEPDLVAAAERLFGSWTAAREAAFPEEREHRWSPERVLAMIQERAESGRPLTTTVVLKECQLLCRHARRYFGSWQGALEAAGVAEQAAAGRRPRKARGHWTVQAVIEAVQERARKGLLLTYAEVRRADPSLIAAGCRLFGNWSKALQAALQHAA